VLGDNIIETNIKRAAGEFFTQAAGAKILLKEVPDPERFGVAELSGPPPQGKITRIVEKPANPASNYAVTGIYFYDNRVFEICRTLKPSQRNELEITDVNNAYLHAGELSYDVLEGWWTDAGTFESLHRASCYVAESGANHTDPDAGKPALFRAAAATAHT
jgi:glucose-1-phosphate thymidylyltransferase